MLKLRYSASAMMLLLTLGGGFGSFAGKMLPSIPEAHAANISMTLTGCAFVVGVCTSTGWNGTTTRPNPTITVQQGDTVSVSLSSSDGSSHLFLVDADRDGAGDTADCPTVDPCSTLFSTTATTYTFTVSFAPGTYTYFCTIHPSSMFASFIVVGGTIGGTVHPPDKLGIIIPYVGLAIAALGMIAAGFVYLMHRRKDQVKFGCSSSFGAVS